MPSVLAHWAQVSTPCMDCAHGMNSLFSAVLSRGACVLSLPHEQVRRDVTFRILRYHALMRPSVVQEVDRTSGPKVRVGAWWSPREPLVMSK